MLEETLKKAETCVGEEAEEMAIGVSRLKKKTEMKA
jgi:hypothetical protein